VSVDSANEHIDLTGQVAIVTGGGRGIGRAMALALARAGAAVAVVARTANQLAETVALIEEAGGRAVACPAEGGPPGPLWESDPDAWWQCVEVNLRGPYLCSRAVLPGMVTRRCGRIVTTASGAGLRPWPYAAAYAISKCAAIRFSESLAAETAGHGIRAFAIGPGFVRTAMTETAAESPEWDKWLSGFFRKALAAGRDVPPERAANLVVYLASGRADALSGCYISVDDDAADMVRRAAEIRQEELHALRLRT
jgi:NAD(P)-dependent dehydrogenase (short-subunit alcohol dehydrogenase family)